MTVLLLSVYRYRPLHLFGLVGLASSFSGLVIDIYLSVLWILGDRPIGNRPLLALGSLLIILGIQVLMFGLLAEMITAATYRRGDVMSLIRAISRGRRGGRHTSPYRPLHGRPAWAGLDRARRLWRASRTPLTLILPWRSSPLPSRDSWRSTGPSWPTTGGGWTGPGSSARWRSCSSSWCSTPAPGERPSSGPAPPLALARWPLGVVTRLPGSLPAHTGVGNGQPHLRVHAARRFLAQRRHLLCRGAWGSQRSIALGLSLLALPAVGRRAIHLGLAAAAIAAVCLALPLALVAAVALAQARASPQRRLALHRALAWCGTYAASFLLYGAAHLAMLKALAIPIPVPAAGIVIGVAALAWALGTINVFSPSGIGTRELVLIYGLARLRRSAGPAGRWPP